MASVYKPKGRHIYRIEFKDQHGKTRTISSGTDDERVAESLSQKIEEDADRIRVGMAPKHLEISGPYLGLVPLEPPKGAHLVRGQFGRAGIPYRDERGRVADFHALRYTFCALLARQYPIGSCPS